MFRVIATIFVTLVLFLPACDRAGHRKRPYGYIKIGKIADFTEPETHLPDLRFNVFKDEQGFRIMSTLCTYDLSALKKETTVNGYIWKSDFSKSTYSSDGKVLTGPATDNLPYYEGVFDQADIKSPRDTLYVHVGKERSSNWQLKFNASQD